MKFFVGIVTLRQEIPTTETMLQNYGVKLLMTKINTFKNHTPTTFIMLYAFVGLIYSSPWLCISCGLDMHGKAFNKIV